ncbi:MAG: class I SAM-dependent methyltransferase [Acidobacteriaceae bacterium]
MPQKRRPDYGIDAPGVIRNLALAGAVLIALAIWGPAKLKVGPLDLLTHAMFYWVGSVCFAEAILMLLYAKHGKFIHRDAMISRLRWRGDERVLDVGTGRGLLLIAAAKHLNAGGRASGIDIWKTSDLSGNARNRTEANLEIEGVGGRCELREEDAQKMSFANGSFDVVLSNLCLHNIASKRGRDEACRDIARVLRPGGVALISDFKNTADYAAIFRSEGLAVKRSGPDIYNTFPPLRIVEARKP